MDTQNDAQMELLARARAAGPPPSDLKSKFHLRSASYDADDDDDGSAIKSGENADMVTSKQSWHEAAKNVYITPRTLPYPRLHEFEKFILPSVQTLRAQFICDICPHCHRPIIESVLNSIHINACRKRKEEAQAKLNVGGAVAAVDVKMDDKNGDTTTKRKRKTGATVHISDPALSVKNGHNNSNNNNTTEDTHPNKKLKPSTKSKDSKSTRIAKQNRQSKQARQAKEKPSVVYNPDKNCGVLMPNGQPCMRSLTCKQHPMGAKRAVVGRTAPYDILLSNYHRQHQMKQAQLTASAAQAAQFESDQLQEQQAQQNPEKEVSQVFEGVRRVIHAPLATNDNLSSTSFRLRNFRLREMLSVALLPRRLPPTGGVLYGRSIAFPCNNPESYRYVRSQAVQQAVYITQIQQRQQQLQQQQEAAAAASVQANLTKSQQSNAGTKSGTPVTPGVTMSQQQQQQQHASQKQLQQAQQAYHMQQAQSVRIQAQQRLKQVQKLKDPYNLG